MEVIHSDFNKTGTRTIGADATAALTHDKNGNITDTMNTLVNASRFFGGGLRMEWDALNRLRKVHYNNNTPGNTADDTLLLDVRMAG